MKFKILQVLFTAADCEYPSRINPNLQKDVKGYANDLKFEKQLFAH